MSNRRNRQGPPEQPPQKVPLYNATVVFHAPNGDIALDWNATNGNVTVNGQLVHNTNDLAVLHTMAKGMSAAKQKEPQ